MLLVLYGYGNLNYVKLNTIQSPVLAHPSHIGRAPALCGWWLATAGAVLIENFPPRRKHRPTAVAGGGGCPHLLLCLRIVKCLLRLFFFAIDRRKFSWICWAYSRLVSRHTACLPFGLFFQGDFYSEWPHKTEIPPCFKKRAGFFAVLDDKRKVSLWA